MNKLILTAAVCLIIGSLKPSAAESDILVGAGTPTHLSYKLTSTYEVVSIAGVDVLLSPEVCLDKKLKKRTIDRLTRQIDSVHRLLPTKKLAALKPIKLWVELNSRERGYAEYHAYKSWLSNHKKNPDKFKGIEITNIQNYLNWSIDDPLISSVLLHEIAHAYFHSLSEQQKKAVLRTYLKATRTGLYRNVFRLGSNSNGRPITINQAWALQDEWEYFSELTESIFAKNDYFPHTSRELERYDPLGYRLVKSLWE